MTESFSAPLKDSGSRATFSTGAVRDNSSGKGRMDLLPAQALRTLDFNSPDLGLTSTRLGLRFLLEFLSTQNRAALNKAAVALLIEIEAELNPVANFDYTCLEHVPLALTELAKHFEKGAQKYAARNWEKGINVSRYIDSAIRHLCQHLSGARDEPHLIAGTWNTVCLLQTLIWIDMGVLPTSLDDLPLYLQNYTGVHNTATEANAYAAVAGNLAAIQGHTATAIISDDPFVRVTATREGNTNAAKVVETTLNNWLYGPIELQEFWAVSVDDLIEFYQNTHDEGHTEGWNIGWDDGWDGAESDSVILSDELLGGFSIAGETKATQENITQTLTILHHVKPTAADPLSALTQIGKEHQENHARISALESKLVKDTTVRAFKIEKQSVGSARVVIFVGSSGYFVYPDGRVNRVTQHKLSSYLENSESFPEIQLG